MAQAVTHLCFESNTMTAEALSPPNPAESLRERLIREGKIVPAKEMLTITYQTPSEQLAEVLARLKELVEQHSLDNARKKLTQRYLLQALEYYEQAVCIRESSSKEGGQKILFDYYTALSINQIKMIGYVLRNIGKNLSNKISILRSGFFFAFKENMKNTP